MNLEQEQGRVLTLENLHKVWKPNKLGGTLHCYYGRNAGAPKLGEIIAANRQEAEQKLFDEPDDILLEYIAAKKPKPTTGNFEGMILAFRGDPEFQEIAKSTQATWEMYIKNDIRPTLGHYTRRDISKPIFTATIRDWRNKYSETPAKANTMLTIIKQVFKFAVINGWIERNPAELLKPLAEKDRSHIVWHEWELAALIQHASPNIANALRLAILTGLRRSDLIKLKWSDISEYEIKVRTNKSKGKNEQIIPVTQELQSVLDNIGKPKDAIHTPVVTNRFGKAYKANSITQGLIKARAKIRVFNPDFAYDKETKSNKDLHDMRGTAATKDFAKWIAESGIASRYGWAGDGVKIAPKYVNLFTAYDIAKQSKNMPCKPSVNHDLNQSIETPIKTGAGDEIRTHDIHLGKVKKDS